ncbi:hypothetical protein RB195_023212 [Necator americanus]|uniref:Uncharacterized protein n=1 Tax=Necator americanus TaxID=51031 RepID=A0ABR1EKJ1_NECAM
MSGHVTLRSHKGPLTRYCNILTRLLDKQSSTQPDALNNFTTALDDLQEPLTEENDKQVTQYLDKAHVVLVRAQERIIHIEGQLLRSGKIWEFSNFWTLFDANVHQQPLTRLQKFNYLVNALRGEARELIRRYPIIDSNYDQAVDLLHSKYGNESALIGNLQLRLETAKAESGRIKAQRRLLETITPIVTQLQEQRVNLDGSYFSQKTLAKFSTTLQRQALQEYVSQNTQESDWKMSRTLSILDNLISTEEKINEMVNRNDRVGTTSTYQSEKSMRIPSQNVERSRGIRMMCRRVSRRLMSVVNCTARLLIPS